MRESLSTCKASFTENWMQAVILSPEIWWLESGCGDNIEVSGNKIEKCHSIAINVVAELTHGIAFPAGAHKNIEISGNDISGCPAPQIAVGSTDKLVIRKNRIHSPGKPIGIGDAIKTEKCTNQTVEENLLIQ